MNIMNFSTIEELEAKVKLLEAENQRLKDNELNLLRALPEIVFRVDLFERITFLNDSCLDKLRLTQNDIAAGISLSNILTKSSIELLRHNFNNLINSKDINNLEVTAIKHDGTEFPMLVYVSRLVQENKLTGFLGVGFDITNQKHIEHKLTEANHAKVKFFSIIAHDLKNPFNSLVGFSNLLLTNLEKYSTEKVREYLGYISKSANQGFLLLDNLLEWSRAQTGRLEISPEHFNMSQAVNETIGLLQTSAEKKEITILSKGSHNIYAFADYNMIRTVIRNLLSNAIKFTYRHGTIKTQISTDNCFVVIDIIDNGVGISEEHLQNLFNIDNELSNLGTERENGTGLGLILCHEFVTQNNGSIEVFSKLGEGSTFRLKIPLFEGYAD